MEKPVLRDLIFPQNVKENNAVAGGCSSGLNAPGGEICRDSGRYYLPSMELEVPIFNSDEKKLAWLHSQIIGKDVEFDSPMGKRRVTYADHTASGRSLNYIENFLLKNVLPFYGNTHTGDSYVGHRTTTTVNEASGFIKNCLGGGEEDALLFCGSGCTAAIKRLQEVMGISVTSILRERVIKTLTQEERWVIFVGPFEHHSNLLSWRQSSGEVVAIGLNKNGLLDMEALKLQLEVYKLQNRPMLGSFSACSNVTGILSDTRKIAHLLHRYGAFACFDFAASGPYVKIDMRSGEMDGYDAVFMSPHKFIGGPSSPGILLMNKALYQLRTQPPSTCGGGTVAYVNGFSEQDTLYYEEIEERENGGTPQIIQIIRAGLAFWVKEYITYQVIEKQEENYIERALERLLPNKNIGILGNTKAKRLSILSFLISSTTNSSLDHETKQELYLWRESGYKRDKPLHGAFVATLLSDLFGIMARGGCSCAGPYGHTLLNIEEAHSQDYRSAIEKGYVGVKPGWTRVSFPYYMSNEEFEFILDAMEFIALYGQRFLPLYNFNLRDGSWKVKTKALNEIMKKKKNTFFIFEKDNIDNGVSKSKYEGYLEVSRSIANVLPKYPSQKKLQADIDPNLLFFRV